MLISLWGFMGAGKSTIGHHLANRLGWKCVDTDAEIEEQQGCTITQIFERNGEDAFRQMETSFLEQLCASRINQTEQIVLVTGGGMPIRPVNRELLSKLGTSIFIDVPFSMIVARLQQDQKRPLWNPEQLDIMRIKFEERLPIYRTADLSINADQHAEDIVQSIMGALNML